MRIFGFGVFGMFSLFSVKRWVRVEREWPAVLNVVQLRCLRRWECSCWLTVVKGGEREGGRARGCQWLGKAPGSVKIGKCYEGWWKDSLGSRDDGCMRSCMYVCMYVIQGGIPGFRYGHQAVCSHGHWQASPTRTTTDQ